MDMEMGLEEKDQDGRRGSTNAPDTTNKTRPAEAPITGFWSMEILDGPLGDSHDRLKMAWLQTRRTN